MGKDKNNEPGYSVGSRTEKAHAEDGWQLGGRKEAEDLPPYDPSIAQHHRDVHQQNVERNGR